MDTFQALGKIRDLFDAHEALMHDQQSSFEGDRDNILVPVKVLKPLSEPGDLIVFAGGDPQTKNRFPDLATMAGINYAMSQLRVDERERVAEYISSKFGRQDDER